jgi:hypothetical protein
VSTQACLASGDYAACSCGPLPDATPFDMGTETHADAGHDADASATDTGADTGTTIVDTGSDTGATAIDANDASDASDAD